MLLLVATRRVSTLDHLEPRVQFRPYVGAPAFACYAACKCCRKRSNDSIFGHWWDMRGLVSVDSLCKASGVAGSFLVVRLGALGEALFAFFFHHLVHRRVDATAVDVLTCGCMTSSTLCVRVSIKCTAVLPREEILMEGPFSLTPIQFYEYEPSFATSQLQPDPSPGFCVPLHSPAVGVEYQKPPRIESEMCPMPSSNLKPARHLSLLPTWSKSSTSPVTIKQSPPGPSGMTHPLHALFKVPHALQHSPTVAFLTVLITLTSLLLRQYPKALISTKPSALHCAGQFLGGV